jgi:predicted DNA-binding transcriptional regulator YafY
MSHDTDKLIRQLSLVAFLMADRRPLTARDVKQNVEGYSEMSDEAFARRFYSDRAELLSLGVPLQSQRDEFTGEELYTLRTENYFLPKLELTNEELAALQTCLYLLEGQFAYAEPFRLALQNLTLGRPGFREAPTDIAERVEMRDPDYSPELAGRLSKLETAISKQRTVKFEYWSIARGVQRERTLDPYALLPHEGSWYVVGRDHGSDAIRTFKVLRIRKDIKFATRRERDFRLPKDFDAAAHRPPPPWQMGDAQGEARIELSGDTAWWVERTYRKPYGHVDDGVFVTPYADLSHLAAWILRLDGRAVPLEPDGLRRTVASGLRRVAERHTGAPPVPAKARPRPAEEAADRPSGPVNPERFGVLQALLAYLLAACGEESSATIPARDLIDRFPQVPEEALEEHLSLLNLVNFGGGCYAVYAELRGDEIHVDKELFGDTFRSPPRLTPLEARAIRLALEFVGPMIAAEAHRPLDRVRKKLEDTFGEFDLQQTAPTRRDKDEETLIRTLSDAIKDHGLVEIEYWKVGEDQAVSHLVEPHVLERELPYWYVHTWDRTRDGQRSFRLDRMRSASATGETFEPREGFEPVRLRDARVARILYSKDIARWEVERGAQELADGTALMEQKVGSPEWLVSEILRFLGEAVVVEPEDLRKLVASRAKALLSSLGLARLRVPA